MARSQIKLSQRPDYSFQTGWMRNYNFVCLSVWKVNVFVGRPIVPLINKGVVWWEQTHIHRIHRYYQAMKMQVDNHLEYQSIYSNGTEGTTVNFAKEEQQKDWTIQCAISEMGMSVPIWLRLILSKRVEKYYEKQYQQQIAGLPYIKDIRDF